MTHPNDTPQPQDHLPDACYPCAIEECALEHTWPAHELHWWDGEHLTFGEAADWADVQETDGKLDMTLVKDMKPGFYCANCLAHVMLAPSDRETLEEVMKRQQRSAA